MPSAERTRSRTSYKCRNVVSVERRGTSRGRVKAIGGVGNSDEEGNGWSGTQGQADRVRGGSLTIKVSYIIVHISAVKKFKKKKNSTKNSALVEKWKM